MPLRRAIALLFTFALVAVGCGDDDSSGPGGGGALSVEAMLAELPELPDGPNMVSIGDLDLATELAGLERPDTADTEAFGAWLRTLTGGMPDRRDAPFVPLAELLFVQGDPKEIADELGWTVADVSRFAEVSAPPHRFVLVTGEDLGEDTFDGALVTELEEGVVTAGEGEDLHFDLEGRTIARPLGVPLRMAATDRGLVATQSTEMARNWLNGEHPASLADSEPHRAIAAALDGHDASFHGVFIAPGADEAGGEVPMRPGGPVLTARFDLVGVGWAHIADEAVMVFVHHWGDADTAASQVEAIEAILTEGELLDGSPYADRLVLEEVTSDGPVTITTVRPGQLGNMRLGLDLVIRRESLFFAS